MTKEDWESLTSSPSWPAFRKFLLDRRTDVMEAIAGDHLVDMDRDKAIRECIIYKEMAELTWPQVAAFYGIPLEEPKEEETKT